MQYLSEPLLSGEEGRKMAAGSVEPGKGDRQALRY